jgi:RNA polymerase sigma-70 factor (ECF subfamily)
MSEAAVPAVMSSETALDLKRILREHAPLCQRLAASHEADAELARDLAQGIAQYRIATHVSRAVREPALAPLSDDLVAPAPTPEATAIHTDERARLTSLVRALPISLREVAVLLLEGFTPAEIADTLGITVNAVAIRGSRAREALRAALEEQR